MVLLIKRPVILLTARIFPYPVRGKKLQSKGKKVKITIDERVDKIKMFGVKMVSMGLTGLSA